MKKNLLATKDSFRMQGLLNPLVSLPTPLSISFLWNIGFLLGLTLFFQVITGLFLSMNYIPSEEEAFSSVVHIMRDLDFGWIFRYLHMNMASLYFILLYFHIFRGIFYNSPRKLPLVWLSGVVILLSSMGAAFMGYVLPWGQMSFWGATVITSMISSIPYIGGDLTIWLWGGFSVSGPTLNRFFSLHFLLPLVILFLVVIHLVLLHSKGSSNPTGTNPDYDKVKFYPYFLVKDLSPLVLLSIFIFLLISVHPNLLGDVENFNVASPMQTPVHIQPEWYFLFSYSILRAIPSKLGGVVSMLLSILVLLILVLKSGGLSMKFSPYKKFLFFSWLGVVFLLTWLGSNPVEAPYILLSKFLSTFYFLFMILF